MKTKSFILGVALVGTAVSSYGQVGVGTDTPEATLDVRATNHLGAVTGTDGILVPRVNDLTTAGTVNGQLVYLVADAGSFTKGFHYWNGSAWVWMSDSATGDITKDAWIDNNGNTRIELGTLSDGTTARPAGTEFVALDNGNVGIGSNLPLGKLDIDYGLTSVAGNESTTSLYSLVINAARAGKVFNSQGIGFNVGGGSSVEAAIIAKGRPSPADGPSSALSFWTGDSFDGFEERMEIGRTGDLQLFEYLNTRDNSGVTAPINFLYTDEYGGLLSAPISAIGASSLVLYDENPVSATAASATGNNSVAIGDNSVVANSSSAAVGGSASVVGDFSFAIGDHVNVSGNNTYAIGQDIAASQDNSLILGALPSSSAALNVGIATETPQERLDVAGSFANKKQLTNGTYTGVYSGNSWLGSGIQSTSIYNIPNSTYGAGDQLNYLSVQNTQVGLGVLTNPVTASQNGSSMILNTNVAQIQNDVDATDEVFTFVVGKGLNNFTNWYAAKNAYTATENSTKIEFDATTGVRFYMRNSGVGSFYTFPRTDGTAGQVLTTNGAGTLSWIGGTGGVDLSNDAWVNNSGSTRVELGTTSTGAARTAGTEFVALDNGRVGIGTTTPSTRLSNSTAVPTSETGASVSTTNGLAWYHGNSGYAGAIYNGDGGTNSGHGLLAKVGGVNPTQNIFVANSGPGNGTDRLVVRGDGNVGVGTNAPSTKLHVQSASSGALVKVETTTSANSVGISLTNSNGGGLGQANWYVATNAHSLNDFIIQDVKNATTRLKIEGNNGNVGIGTTSSTATSRLHLNGANGYNQLRLEKSYTPTSSADTNGNTGDMAWDANYIYIKTASGWKRSALATF
ncbi:MAG: hypothetical protein H6604_02185 [Flavobacteriales bacterium]|nr:hypothetical protein [Flavobacteriales bacterium]